MLAPGWFDAWAAKHQKQANDGIDPRVQAAAPEPGLEPEDQFGNLWDDCWTAPWECSRSPLVIEPRETPREGLVLLFHGAGGSPRSWEGLAEAWAAELPRVKFVAPAAPRRDGGTSWMSMDRETGRLCDYEAEWCEALRYIEEERAQHCVPINRVVLVGFSIGAVMASWVVQNLPWPCGGLVLLSGPSCCPAAHIKAHGWFPPPRLACGVEKTSVLCFVGLEDEDFHPETIRRDAEALRQRGFSVEYRELPGVGHEVVEEEAEAVLAFLLAALPQGSRDLAEEARDHGVGQSLDAEILRISELALAPALLEAWVC